jgi:hypothetical protein
VQIDVKTLGFAKAVDGVIVEIEIVDVILQV